MSAGRRVLIISSAVACLLACAAAGILLLSRHDMRMAMTLPGKVNPLPMQLTGVHLAGGSLRIRYLVHFIPHDPMRFDWCLWPFRKITEAAPMTGESEADLQRMNARRWGIHY